jgi:hypothetical protein
MKFWTTKEDTHPLIKNKRINFDIKPGEGGKEVAIHAFSFCSLKAAEQEKDWTGYLCLCLSCLVLLTFFHFPSGFWKDEDHWFTVGTNQTMVAMAFPRV